MPFHRGVLADLFLEQNGGTNLAHQNHADVSRLRLLPPTEEMRSVIEDWVAAPHVRRWWDVHPEALARLRAPRDGDQRFISLDEQVVGVVQWRPVDPSEWRAVGLTVPEGSLEVDILIGVERNCGQGLGSAAIGRLVEGVGWAALIATSSLANLAARRAFQKAGFVEADQFYRHGGGRMVLMTRVSAGADKR